MQVWSLGQTTLLCNMEVNTAVIKTSLAFFLVVCNALKAGRYNKEGDPFILDKGGHSRGQTCILGGMYVQKLLLMEPTWPFCLRIALLEQE